MGVVLVVDSQGEVMRGVTDALSGRSGCHAIIERMDGRSAISALREGIPVDAVVSDERLADMEGLEFIAAVRRIDPELPVIMVGSVLSAETYLKAMHAGVFDLLARPVDKVFLRRVITTAMEEQVYFQTAMRVTGGPGRADGMAPAMASRTSS